jgi:hypothetical protein
MVYQQLIMNKLINKPLEYINKQVKIKNKAK